MSRCWVMGYFDSIKDFQRHSESSQTSKLSHYALLNHSLPTTNSGMNKYQKYTVKDQKCLYHWPIKCTGKRGQV